MKLQVDSSKKMKELCIFEKGVKNGWTVDIFPLIYFLLNLLKIIPTYSATHKISIFTFCHYVIQPRINYFLSIFGLFDSVFQILIIFLFFLKKWRNNELSILAKLRGRSYKMSCSTWNMECCLKYVLKRVTNQPLIFIMSQVPGKKIKIKINSDKHKQLSS